METAPSWSTIQKYFLSHSNVREIPFEIGCEARLVIDPAAPKMCFDIEYDQEIHPSWKRLKNIEFSYQPNALRIMCVQAPLFEFFYRVVIAIVDDIHANQTCVEQAIEEALKSLRLLLSQQSEHSNRDEVVGLWGEIHVLERLISSFGQGALDSWFGPKKQVHDFRFDSGAELEVKTTQRERRDHVISNLTQLQASPGCQLYLYSIGICETPAGESLHSKIDRILTVVNDQTLSDYFQNMIESFKWYRPDGEEENIKYAERYAPAIGGVDEKFPKITMGCITEKFGKSSSKIKDVRYTVNVEGFVAEEGSDEYNKIWRSLNNEH